MADIESTQYFGRRVISEEKVMVALKEVYQALAEKGYEPNTQIVGYLLSGDPVYITSHKGARGLIQSFSRDEIMEVMLKVFLANGENRC